MNLVEALIFSGFFLPIAEIGKFTAMITLHFHLNMQTISESETSEIVCQDSNLLVDTSLVDIPYTIFDTTSTCAVLVTTSGAISFYAFCFSVLIKLVVFGTLIH